MTSDLLETKLRAPKPRAALVHRPRLLERLARSVRSKLTLVSAPPGFGKSTVVADWLHDPTGPHGAAWLSLDPDDDDAALFWRYLVAALRTVHADIGREAAAMLEPPEPQVARAVRSVLNDLALAGQDVLLVLDDLHVIERREIHDDLAFLIDRLPAQAHLVVTTRADPPLPLARLRARGELVEIRAGDLRFTADEAAAYLGTMGLHLGSADVHALEARTEGWIAALQLAALSMEGRGDPGSFIRSFAGDDRYVVDYLADEVLARQPDDVRRFLLQTSILDRLTGPLCDAVTGRSDGRAVLDRLERANLFLVPLDDQRRWYRYHQLFADVLRSRILDEDGGTVAELHRSASDWLERNGDRSEAIRHALAGGDHLRAADRIEQAVPELSRARAEVTLRRWLEALPGSVVMARPVLAAALAGSRMQIGELTGVADLLDAAEATLEASGPAAVPAAGSSGSAVADRAEDEDERLAGHLAMLRAGYARITGDLPATIDAGRRALELAAPDDHLTRGGSAGLLGLAWWETGDLRQAHRSFAEGMRILGLDGYRSDVVGGQVTLADIRAAQGRLGDAMDAYRRGLALATDGPGPPLRGAADMWVGMSDILRERNDLVGAREHLDAGRELGEAYGLPKYPSRSRLAAARLRQAEGDADGALALLDEAERVFFADFAPVTAPIPAIRARLSILQGGLAAAREWAERARVDPADDIRYVGQFDLATLARLLLAEGRIDGSIALAGRLVAAARAHGWTGAAIDALIVQALGTHARGDGAEAVAVLRAAVDLGGPGGYVRIFLDEGPAMARLIRLAARQADVPGHLQALARHASPDAGRVPVPQGLVEPLSARELDVLRLLRSELDGPGIASELVVSLNTLRTHTKNIYAKLGVGTRRAAVRRAEELGLL